MNLFGSKYFLGVVRKFYINFYPHVKLKCSYYNIKETKKTFKAIHKNQNFVKNSYKLKSIIEGTNVIVFVPINKTITLF